MKRALLACLLLALLPGCAQVAEATRPATEAIGKVLLTPEQEKQLGEQLSVQVQQQEKVLQQPEVQSYVDRVGRQVLSSISDKQRRQLQYSFTVLDNPETVNAFALPAGYIYVYSGLLRAVQSEAELASVLAHEIAHVVADHPSQQLASAVGLQALEQLALGKNPGLVAQLGATIAAQGYLAANTREQEQEADTLGLGFLAGSGYDPQAMPRFFNELASMSKSNPNFVESFFATHPAPAERAQRLEALIQKEGLGPGREAIVGDLGQIQAQVGGGTKVGQAAP
jgi:predicted Zn-dependent protease